MASIKEQIAAAVAAGDLAAVTALMGGAKVAPRKPAPSVEIGGSKVILSENHWDKGTCGYVGAFKADLPHPVTGETKRAQVNVQVYIVDSATEPGAIERAAAFLAAKAKAKEEKAKANKAK